jgi:cell division protein ZapE
MRLFADSPPLRDSPPMATADQFPGPMPEYRARRAANLLKRDPMQELATEKLQMLHRALRNYKPQPAAPVSGGWRQLLGLVAPQEAREPRPRGIYLYGGVGRGKSMLMDLFFETSAVPRRRRVHFHAFMQEVHDRLHRLRTVVQGDPLAVVGREIAADAWLLCFDEMQVSDIADAMIIGRLFEALFAEGVVVVATSNRAPDELYKDGLQRERFLPFIDLLKQEMDVLELDNGRDYRRSRLAGRQVYYTPLDGAAAAALEEIFVELTDGLAPEPMTIEIKKRLLVIPKQAAGIAWFTFAELCGTPLGAGDYLALAERFDTLILAEVPRLGPEMRNEAKRFNTLIDALYEAKAHVVISAEAPAAELYPEGDGAFEFERTVSRLLEMQSLEYVTTRKLPGIPGSESGATLAGSKVSR